MGGAANRGRAFIVIDLLVEFVKGYLLPGSLPFFLAAASIGVVLLFLRAPWPKIGRIWLGGVALTYWLLATPWMSQALAWTLGHSYRPIETAESSDVGRAIVVLGGGSVTYHEGGRQLSMLDDASVLRILEGVRLYNLLQAKWVITSGGPSAIGAEAESSIMAKAMVELGVPADRIVEEPTSSNTYDEAVNLKALLASRDIPGFILVTSSVHMPRAMAVFRHVGLDPVPSPAPELSASRRSGLGAVLPSPDALHTSQAAIRELMGLFYYGVRGWLSPAPSLPSSLTASPRETSIEIVGSADERQVGQRLGKIPQVFALRP